MNIYLIWAVDGDDTSAAWLIGAWDDDSVSGNREGYEQELASHRKDYGAEAVRVVKARIDFDAVLRAFEVPGIGTAEVIGEADREGWAS